MTNELEKQFFDTFGIEPKWKSEQCDGWMRTTDVAYFTNLEEAKKFGIVFQEEPEYPQISDRILLELICIWNLYCTHTLIPTDYQKVKEYVLEQFANIDTYKFIVDTPIVKLQVRALFEEG